MDLEEKIVEALSNGLRADFVHLQDDDGISGYVVSSVFRNMSTLDRQEKIEDALSKASLTADEHREVLMVAGLTPEEYESAGAGVTVHKVRSKGNQIEVLLHGQKSDADYVRLVLSKTKGIQVAPPKQVSGAMGILMTVRAKSTSGKPLTATQVIRILKADPYINVKANLP